MSQDFEHEKGLQQESADTEAGTGSRSLQYWQSLASARVALTNDQEAQRDFQADPKAFMEKFGCEMDVASGERAYGESELEDLELHMREISTLEALALAAVAVAGNANKVGNLNAAGNANVAGNANGVGNWNGIGPSDV